MKRAVEPTALACRLVIALIFAAGCTTPPDTTEAASPTALGTPTGGGSPTAEAEETSTTAPTAPPSEDPDYRAALEAREAAWQAWIDSVSPPEANPQHRALRRTHAEPLLLHVTRHAMDLHSSDRTWRYLPESEAEVQSITFPDDTTAWLETCIVTYIEDLVGPRGKVLRSDLSTTGTTTVQQTDVMSKEDGVWKLAQSIVNSAEDGHEDCPIGDHSTPASDDIYSAANITRARETSEAALLDLLTTKKCCALGKSGLKPFSDTHTGHMLNQYTYQYTSERHLEYEINERPTRYFSSAVDCPIYPGTGMPPKPPDHTYLRRTYALFDKYWKQQYDDTDPQYGNSSPGCLRQLNTRSPVGAFRPQSRSNVVVQSLTVQAADAPVVAYITTCTHQKLESTDGSSDMRIDQAIVRATESMRLVDGTWKLANRWDFSVEQATRAGCDER